MKAIACYALHYGAEYLAWSVRSIQDVVDEVHVYYSPKPSFGHYGASDCHESEGQLEAEARRFLTKPLVWHRGEWVNEGHHRDTYESDARSNGVDAILVVDADEIWDLDSAKAALQWGREHEYKSYRVPFVHLWRSMAWCCEDSLQPERVIRVNAPKLQWGWSGPQAYPVFHFGYAQSEQTIKYKWTIHGHQSEFRNGWLENKFLNWEPGISDVHPTNDLDFWIPKPTPERYLAKLKDLVGDHPNWDKDIIR